MATKEKYSFTLNGVPYKDISGYISRYSKDTINIGVSGTAQMIRQWFKHHYPNLPAKGYIWVQSDSYSGGDSIRVYLNNPPSFFYEQVNRELNTIFEEGKFDGMTDSYTYTKGTETSDDGKKVDYGTKYLFVENRKPYGAETPDLTPADWERALKQQSEKPNPMPKPRQTGRTSNYSMGDTLMECSGWTISKKTLSDGRVVYNAKINPSTAKNRSDWNTIKGEIYTETGFKWGRFGAFEKWGTIASESFVVQKLCEILGKYYDGGNQSTPPPQQPSTDPSLPESGKKVEVNVNGMWFGEYDNQNEAYEAVNEEARASKYEPIIFFSVGTDKPVIKFTVLSRPFEYGEKWEVPPAYGNMLQDELIKLGFVVHVTPNGESLIVSKPNSAKYTLTDNGGEFNLDKSDKYLLSINYRFTDRRTGDIILPSPTELAKTISYIVDDETDRGNNNIPQQQQPTPPAPSEGGKMSKQDIEKAIKGLQILAAKGNANAQKAIKGLQILLNK